MLFIIKNNSLDNPYNSDNPDKSNKPNKPVIVTEQEVKAIFDRFSKGVLNPYDGYIQSLRATEESKKDSSGKPKVGLGLENHHIIPKFDGGTNDPSNMILLTVKEHVIAHWLRWMVLNKNGDKIAYLFRNGDVAEALELKLLAILKARNYERENKLGFFNSDFQREMGLRGGSKGGSANTPAQAEARKKVGLAHGRTTGIRNQGKKLKEFNSKYSIWGFSHNQKFNNDSSRDDEVFYLIGPKPAFTDKVRLLIKYEPGSISEKSMSSMNKLVNNERNQLNGWRIVDTLIRSEVGEGLGKFLEENPKSTFHVYDLNGDDLLTDLNLE